MNSQAAGTPRTGRLARLVDSDSFNLVIAGVIIVNAIVLGLETFPAIMDSYGNALILANEICYGIFVVELILRFASYGRRPQDFFKNGWNVFDLVIIGGAWWLGWFTQRRWLGWVVAAIPFLLVLYFVYQNVNRLLPADL